MSYAPGLQFPEVTYPMAAVPVVLTVVTSDEKRLLSIIPCNTSGDPIVLTVTDTAGANYIRREIPAADSNEPAQPMEFPFVYMNGIKIQASAAGLNLQIETYAHVAA